MLEDDMRRLAESDTPERLDRLEADIWKGVDVQARQSRAANTIAAWQVAVVALVMVTGVAGGTVVARAQMSAAATRNAFSPGIEFAPSTLLLGAHL